MSRVAYLTGESLTGRPGGRYPGVATWRGGTRLNANDSQLYEMGEDAVLDRLNDKAPWLDVCRETHELPLGAAASTIFAQALRRLGRRGLLCEEERMNACTSDDFTNAFWTTRAVNCNAAAAPAITDPKGNALQAYLLTQTVAGGYTESNALGIDLTANSIAASVWARKATGVDHDCTIQVNDGAAAFKNATFPLTDQWRRIWIMPAAPAFGAAASYMRIIPHTAGPGDCYVALPQAEQTDAGALEIHEPSSYVKVNGTRPASSFSVLSNLLPPGEWTLIFRYMSESPQNSTAASYRYLFSTDAVGAGSRNCLRVYRNSTSFYLQVIDNYNVSATWTLAGLSATSHPKDSLIPIVITKRQSRRNMWTLEACYNGIDVPYSAGPDPFFWPKIAQDLYVGNLVGSNYQLAGAVHSIEVYDEALDPRLLC
jgi:hypothetical protein